MVSPELLGVVADQVRDPGAVQQGLGRDAADIDADPAELVAFHHGGSEAQLRSADGAYVSSGPAAHDDDVEVGHSSLLEKA